MYRYYYVYKNLYYINIRYYYFYRYKLYYQEIEIYIILNYKKKIKSNYFWKILRLYMMCGVTR